VWCNRGYSLVHWNSIPDYLKYNKFIQQDYRVGITFEQSLASIFHWHNETLNIWTHLGAFFIFALMIPLSLSTWLIGQDPVGVTFCILYILTSMFMLGSSTIFHTFCCISVSHYNILAEIDYLGIGVQIVGSYGILCYYLFKCHPLALSMYTLVVMLLGLAVVIATLKTNIQAPGNETKRLALFIGFGFSLIICGPQSIIIHGWALWPLLWRMMLMGSLYIGGALIYVFQIPERWFPGKLNSYSSHAVWHCFVVAAALSHYFTCFWLVNEKSFDCPA